MKNELNVWRNGRDLFDEAFDAFFKPTFFNMDNGAMRTDVRETEKGYKLEIELPGYKKEDISVSFENGYVSVSAKKNDREESGEGKERYIRKERSMSCSRSYYVGDIAENEIKAKFDGGVLTLELPKEKDLPPARHNIDID